MTTVTSSSNVYQLIWDADQAGNGVRPILSTDTTTPRDKANGYVIVDWPKGNENLPDHKVLQEVQIPDKKNKTYAKCKALYDNYALQKKRKENGKEESVPEIVDKAEEDEIQDFINHIKDTPPMRIAREYLAPGEEDDAWEKSIREKWFDFFPKGEYNSGFEHVFVGENSYNKTIGGYHFWHKYYVDDSNNNIYGKDTIDFEESRLNKDGQEVPEVVTLKYYWNPTITVQSKVRDNGVLVKNIGGFWVGCSPEGLIALGMARWKESGDDFDVVINNAQYNVILAKDDSEKCIKTFYPKFEERILDREEEAAGGVRIIGALVNPLKGDVRNENVTVINTSPTGISLNGWSIEDRNGNAFRLEMMQLGPGEAKTIALSGDPNTAQLVNSKDGIIKLVDSSGTTVNSVSYTRSQAKNDGSFILFDKQDEEAARGVRIIGALVNPLKGDVRNENVTVINTSPTGISLNGWSIEDRNGNAFRLEMMQLGPGEAKTITLSGDPNTAQLVNSKDGIIKLVDSSGTTVNSVSYTRSQAKNDGSFILF